MGKKIIFIMIPNPSNKEIDFSFTAFWSFLKRNIEKEHFSLIAREGKNTTHARNNGFGKKL